MKRAPTIESKSSGKITGKFTIRQYEAGQMGISEPVFEKEFSNVVVSDNTGYGVNLLLRQMAGDAVLPIEIDEIAFGTGTTPPATTDTDMETETVSNVAVQDYVITNNVVVFSFFVPDIDMPDDTYTEVGLKMGGRLFTHAVMNYIKSANKDTSIDYTITINV